MKRLFLVLAVFLGINSSLYAQTNYFLPTLPSPSAASIAQYAEVPVDLQTGKLGYQLPLHTVTYKSLSIPIYLSYNVDGIRLDSPISWAGTGWDLMAGGAISRVKKGNPDEWSSGYKNTGSNSDYLSLVSLLESGSATWTSTTGLGNFVKDNLGNNIDTEQDIFYYNIGGMSGKFVIEPGGTIKTVPRSNVKITANYGSNSINHFNVITPEGVKYTFGSKTNSQEKIDDPILDYTSTWYLTKVESPAGNHSIDLEYNSSDQQDISSFGFEAKYLNYLAHEKPDDVDYDDNQTTIYYYKQLAYIETPVEKVVFEDALTGLNSSEASYQATPRRRIDKIEVESKTASQVVKNIAFTHSITTNDRMYLDEVEISGINSSSPQTHTFEYYGKTSLPGDRSYMGIDLWGYYNGEGSYNQNTAQTYIPSLKVNKSNLGSNYEYAYIEGARREVKPSTVYYGALKKIILPTGGYTEIEYEPNQYSKILYGNTDLKTVNIRTDNFGTSTMQASTSFDHVFSLESDAVSGAFNILEFSFSVMANMCFAQFTLELYQENGSSDILIDSWTGITMSASDKLGNLDNDDYYFRITTPGTMCQDPVILNLNLTINEDKEVSFKYAPGIRVSKVTAHDGMSSSNDIVKEYIYGTGTGASHVSNGVLFQEPAFHFEFPSDGGYLQASYHNGQSYVIQNFWARVSNPVLNLGGDPRGFVGYEKVQVNHGTGGSEGYEIHFFNIETMIPDNVVMLDYINTAISNKEIFPLGPDLRYRFSEKLWSESFKSNSDKVSRNAQRTKYFDTTSDTDDAEVFLKYPKIGLYTFRQESKLFSLSYNYSLWQRPELDSMIVYDSSGNSLTSIAEYEYDDYGIQQLVKKTETNSDGTERVTEYEYAYEDHQTAMESLNMLTQPYSVTIKDGSGTVLSKQWTLWNQFNGDWHPCGVWVWNGGAVTPPANCSSN